MASATATAEGVLLAPRSGYMHLSSEYGTSNNNDTSSVSYAILDPIATYSDTYCMLIGVHNMTLPHVFYNMKGYNFSVSILPNTDGIPVSTFPVTLPTQNYTAPLLASTLSTLLSNYASLVYGLTANFWVMSYDSNTNYFTLTCDAVVPFQINYVANNCYYELGAKKLAANVSTLTNTDLGSCLFPNAADLSGTNGVYVNLVGYNTNQRPSYSGLQQSNILCRIPIDTPFGAVQIYSPDNIQFAAIPNAAFSAISITLTDDEGKILNMQGCDYTMTLEFKYLEILKPAYETANSRVSMSAFSQPYGR